MTERLIYLVIASALAGLVCWFADRTLGNYDELTLYGDFARWKQSPGTLKSMALEPASSGKDAGLVVVCEYTFAFADKIQTGTTFELGSNKIVGGASAAKARVESALGIAGRAPWRAVSQDGTEGWVLEVNDLPISVRHSERHPSASTLTDKEPMPAFAYWLLIGLTSVLAVVAALGSLFFLLIARDVGSTHDYLKDPLWCEHLFADHPKGRLREWARSMRHFRFIRGPGGGMGDYGDRLAVVFKVDSRQDVERILATLGIPRDARGIALVRGVEVVISETGAGMELSITDHEKPYEVTQSAVESARMVEIDLERLTDRLVDPPKNDRYCLSPKFYPSFWEDEDDSVSVKPATVDDGATTERRRHQAVILACLGAALLFLGAIAWRDLADDVLMHSASANMVFEYLHQIGGRPFAMGAFVVPGILFLAQARHVLRTLKREERRRRRRRRRA